ncbi:MAG TPA: hypothetical protein VMT34_18380, partial [Aggregatilineales bacterium]|nr:hypothetical protein [Aggregatilineales bacterium]
MSVSLEHTLNAFRYYLPRVVSRETLARLHSVTGQFPALLTSEIVIETLLHPASDDIDFSMYVNT